MRNNISGSFNELATPIFEGIANSLTLGHYNESSSTFSDVSQYSESSSAQKSVIFDVARWFLSKESMSHKKLQKLCYYAYAWFLVFFNDQESVSATLNTLCATGFEAWVHGPVSPELYHMYKGFGWNDIPKEETCPAFPKDVVDLLNQVWDAYGSFSADQLERLTHTETPWQEARKGKRPDEPSNVKIDDKQIFYYYSKMMER